jgi:O-methyltransferase
MIGNALFLRIKKTVFRYLSRHPRLRRSASRMLYMLDRSFSSLSPEATIAIDAAWRQAKSEGTTGDYYEFGVFRGYTLWHAQQSCRQIGTEAHFWGFDSFRGLPAVEGIDGTDNAYFAGQFSCSRAQVEQYLRSHGADMSQITLVEGFFSDVLTPDLKTRYHFRRAAIVRLRPLLLHKGRTDLDHGRPSERDHNAVRRLE